jgi:hypothetical protein
MFYQLRTVEGWSENAGLMNGEITQNLELYLCLNLLGERFDVPLLYVFPWAYDAPEMIC